MQTSINIINWFQKLANQKNKWTITYIIIPYRMEKWGDATITINIITEKQCSLLPKTLKISSLSSPNTFSRKLVFSSNSIFSLVILSTSSFKAAEYHFSSWKVMIKLNGRWEVHELTTRNWIVNFLKIFQELNHRKVISKICDNNPRFLEIKGL